MRADDKAAIGQTAELVLLSGDMNPRPEGQGGHGHPFDTGTGIDKTALTGHPMGRGQHVCRQMVAREIADIAIEIRLAPTPPLRRLLQNGQAFPEQGFALQGAVGAGFGKQGACGRDDAHGLARSITGGGDLAPQGF